MFKKRNIIWLHGVRRAGKTCLCKSIPNAKYYDCELPAIRREVESENFLEENKNSVLVLDEIHKLGNPSELLKIAADYYPGTKIVATGSSTLGAYKRFKDMLTGRKYDLYLTPAMSDESADFGITSTKMRLFRGGLPGFMAAPQYDVNQYSEWLDSYWVKDIQEIFHFEKRYSYLKFIELLFLNNGGIFEATKYAQTCEVSRATLYSYLTALELTSLIYVIRPFSSRKSAEIVSAPKIYGFDTGFVVFVKGINEIHTEEAGVLWEQLVLNELVAVQQSTKIHYWRDKAGHEVDFVLYTNPDEPVAVECKWQASKFETGNLKIFRKRYPVGNNILIAQDCMKPYKTKIEGLTLQVIGIKDVPIYLNE
ncbi:MAG: DUF4143 domain-containing protein [Elusimicrobiota bacterium]